ncbi:phage major capsid protein [Streptomyces sp. NRRL S-646]|uniref:phage major capsid protein n=1 Tax=Streptomyces sp. NRRL S-646 TaxID=1463917 RepID=UPI0004CC684C|nr:phage major capsid protein [Streptomyces sp. NRRL S-646]
MDYAKLAKNALERRASVISQMRAVLNDAALSEAEKRKRVEGMDAHVNALDAEARDYVERAERENEARSLAGRVGGAAFTGNEERALDGGESFRNGGMLPSTAEFRQMTTTSAAAVIPTQTLGQVFDFLRQKSVFLASGPRVLKMDGKTLSVPRISASTSASMVAEGSSIPVTDMTLQAVTLTAKKAAVLTKATNESLLDSNPELLRIVGEDHMKEVARLLDAQFLAGDGTGNNMRGLRNFSGVTVTSLGTNGASLTLDALADGVGRLESANGDLNGAAWFMSGRSWASIRKAKDGQSRYQVSPDPTQDGERRLFGIPVYISNQISNTETVGTSTDCSWIGLVDLSQIAVGRRAEVSVAYSQDAYFDSDVTGIRSTSRWDVAPLDPNGVQLMTGVRQ